MGWRGRWGGSMLFDQLPAVVDLIDRSPENRAPNRCLPFDGIGALFSGERSIKPATAVNRNGRSLSCISQ